MEKIKYFRKLVFFSILITMIAIVFLMAANTSLADEVDDPDDPDIPGPDTDDETECSEGEGNSWYANIFIDSGTNFDIYAWWNQDISAVFNWNPAHQPVCDVLNVKVTVRAWDVDYPGPSNPEIDQVYLNGEYLGILQGASNTWSMTTFDLTSTQIDNIFGGAAYPIALNPFIDVDVNPPYPQWAVTVDGVRIQIWYDSENVPPTTTKTYGTPFYTDGVTDWITSLTPITLTAVDGTIPGQPASGVKRIWYSWDGVNWWDGFDNPKTFYIPDECEHLIKYYAVDNCGNNEPMNSQYVKVDNTAPVTTKTYGLPFYTDGVDDYISSMTPIYLDAVDPGQHPSGVYGIWYNYGAGWNFVNDDFAAFTIPTECDHLIEYYAVDNLGNVGPVLWQWVKVDNTPPIVHKEHPIHGYYQDPASGKQYLKCCAPITLWAEEVGPHWSGVAGIYWGFTYNGIWHPTDITDNYGGNTVAYFYNGKWWYAYDNTIDIHFTEECVHTIQYWTEDMVWNKGPIHTQTYYVDNTIPMITKTHPPDYVPIDHETGWIKVCSKITLTATDAGTPPCESGVEDIYWGFTFNGVWHPIDATDTYDGNIVGYFRDGKWWYVYDNIKKIHWYEEGYHELEYWTKDNVCNTGDIHLQKYWVNSCHPEVWVDDNYTPATPGWWIDHFSNIQLALDWLDSGGIAHVYDGVYQEDILVDTVPWCDNTGITIEGMTAPPLPTHASAVIEGTMTIKVNGVTVKNFVFDKQNSPRYITVEGNTGITLYHNIFDENCDPDTVGVNAHAGSEVDAVFNWWGAPDGPNGGLMKDGVTIADGYGVKIIGAGATNGVMVEPWIGVYAKATATPNSVEPGQAVVFDAEGSWAADFNGVYEPHYMWDKDDGQYSQEKKIGHVYDTPGTYKPSLEVRGNGIYQLHDNFMYDWAYLVVYVTAPGAPLTAHADAGNLGGYETTAYKPVQLFGLATGGVSPYTYSWDLGDGRTIDEQEPTVIYENEGTYTLTLTVADSTGETATDTAEINVLSSDAFIVEIEAPSNEKPGNTIQFKCSIIGGLEPYSYNWNFGDDTISDTENPTHVYENPGVYTVTLTVTDSLGTTSKDILEINIEESDGTLTIGDITGGLGIKANIKTGDTQVSWSINIDGPAFMAGNANGVIPANTRKTIRSPLVLGLGNIEITLNANSITKQTSAFIIGPFVLIR
jgi:PKD repeat protein